MLIPPKLTAGSTIRIVAPATSMAILSETAERFAAQRLESLGLNVTYGRHVRESDLFTSSPIQSRIEDLHEAFADQGVAAILTALGGHNSNQLLNRLDFDLIRSHPKIFCGFSDITALSNAIWAKTGVVSYCGCHFSSFMQRRGFDYSLSCFRRCLMQAAPFEIEPSAEWSDDDWWRNQESRVFVSNPGPLVLNEGRDRARPTGQTPVPHESTAYDQAG